jgi:hypothetical protein
MLEGSIETELELFSVGPLQKLSWGQSVLVPAQLGPRQKDLLSMQELQNCPAIC